MECPKCKQQSTRVLDSREGADGRSVRRRRECESCAHRFTTYERVEENLPLVIKKDGTREAYDRSKILSGLRKACEKRPVTMEQMEEVCRLIESDLSQMAEKEVPSQVIGELLITNLQGLDQVAYVRFASVYREFSDVSEFMDTLRTLVTKKSLVVEDKKKKIKGQELMKFEKK